MASADLSRINTNIGALQALNALNAINTKLGVHALRLATGKRINSAADDAAGFTIAAKLKVKSEGLGTALNNIGSAKNLMTVAEGHLTNISEILSKMKAKAQQAANDTLGTDERAAILSELQQFNTQIDSEVNQAQWAGVSLLGTSSASNKTFQIGTGTSASDSIAFYVANEVWSGNGTTFNSAGLDIQAAAGTTVTVSSTITATSGWAGGNTVAAVGTINSNASELASGSYTLEVTSTGLGAATGMELTIKLKNAAGNYLAIDADGDAGAAGTSAVDNELFLSLDAATNGDAGVLDLGVGFSIDLGAMSEVATATDSATYTIAYERAGNSVADQNSSQDFMDAVDTAIVQVGEGLSYIGSTINRLGFQEQSLSVAKVNVESAYSRIVDADMAFEQLEATKLMILQQTATAMLAQANVSPQVVLSLFGG